MPPASRPELDRQARDAERLCRRRALDLLARREHSRQELARKLERAFDAGLVGRILDALTQEGLLAEARFAAGFIRARARKGQGPVRIRAELAERGVDPGRIGAALAEADCDWLAIAIEVRARRFGPAAPQDYRERARQAKFLRYRGFGMEQIRAALAAAADERADETDFD